MGLYGFNSLVSTVFNKRFIKENNPQSDLIIVIKLGAVFVVFLSYFTERSYEAEVFLY